MNKIKIIMLSVIMIIAPIIVLGATGRSKTYDIVPKERYKIIDVIVNGVSQGPITSYTFSNMIGSQTIKVITQRVYSISGEIKTYNPNNPTTIQLKQGNNVIKSIEIPAETGSGQITQSFVISDIPGGTYDLVVTKVTHLPYTIKNVVINNDLDLTQNVNEPINIMTLLAGELNGDNTINSTDLNIVWNSENYNKSVANAANPMTDIDGSGAINSTDLNIVWNDANYMKSVADSTFEYTP